MKFKYYKILISKGLIDLYIGHDKFHTVNNVIREYNETKEELKNFGTSVGYTV